MPSKAIKHANKGDIVFSSKANYDQLYSSILRVLGRTAPFAPLTISGNTLMWIPQKSGNYKSLSEAPDEVLALWEKMEKDLRERLTLNKLDFVMNIPDLSYVFYVEETSNGDGVLSNRYQLLITGWACQYGRNRSDDGDDGLRNRMFEARDRHQNVIVKMQNGNKIPLANKDFSYIFESAVAKDIRTDASGCYEQGVCVVGSKLTYIYKETGEAQIITVMKNIEVYPITYNLTTDIHIKVVDQYNCPLQSHNVKIEYGAHQFLKQTDGLGEILLEKILYVDPALQLSIEVENFGTKVFPVDCPKCDIIMRVNLREKTACNLKIVRDGQSVSNHSVKISGGVNGIFASDEHGLIPLGFFDSGVSFEVESVTDKQAELKKYVVVEGETEYLYFLSHVEDEPEPIVPPVEEIDEPVESDDPTPQIEDNVLKDCYVKVVEGDDYIPIPNYSLKFESENMNGIRLTDAEGIVPLEGVKEGTQIKVYDNNGAPYIFVIKALQKEYLIHLTDFDVHTPVVSCYIKVVKGEKQIPAQNFSLYIKSQTMTGNFHTDVNGILPMKDMTVGESVTCFVDRDKSVSFEIEEGREEYLIRIDDDKQRVQGDILITFVGKDRATPVSPATITLTNKRKRQITLKNDSKGSIVVPKSFFTHNEKVKFHGVYGNNQIVNCKIHYKDECDNYIVYLTDPLRWKRLLWLLLLPLILLLSLIQCEHDVTVHTIDEKGRSVGNTVVQMKYVEHALYKEKSLFYNRNRQYQGMTNNEGFYTFKKLPCSVYSYIFYSFQSALATGSKNVLVNGSTKFWFHWNNNVDVVIKGAKAVQVRSRKTDTPIPQARVDVTAVEGIGDTTMITDDSGICYFALNGDAQLAKLDKVIATKYGYSGTQIHDVVLDLNKADPLVIYLDNPDPCQDYLVDNNDRSKGNVAMKDFDMKVAGGEFVFQYFTDTAPDDISVYDGPSSDYVKGSASRIFHYEGATCTVDYSKSANITFSSRYICVVVTGGTNWGYIVRCPVDV
ncbi:hypothetical protein [Bacteroides ndongoniae]|jgi:hypothetical protein|uniref:hypothetical protein n=1 Tax=Bacteroides ndongoniae TaxID=1903262 RepID=UPI0023F707B7|nr:hypothetical protein [Bacteroides ndongoniae]